MRMFPSEKASTLLKAVSILMILLVGVLMAFQVRFVKAALDILCGVALLSFGLIKVGEFFGLTGRKGNYLTLLTGVLSGLLGGYMFVRWQFLPIVITLVYGIWALLNAVFRLISAGHYFVNGDPQWPRRLASGLLSVGLGAAVLSTVNQGADLSFLLIGCYLIYFSLSELYDTVRDLLGVYTAVSPRRRVRVGRPVAASALSIQRMLDAIERERRTMSASEIMRRSSLTKDVPAESSPYSLEVFIHAVVHGGFSDSFGHCDLAIGNQVISYGNYDRSSWRLWGCIADGVIMTTPQREAYLKFCTEVEHKAVVGYTLRFTEEQFTRIQAAYESYISDLVPWQCGYQLAPYPYASVRKIADPADQIYCALKPQFFKLAKKRFKTYFAVSTNCVEMVDTLLGAAGVDRLRRDGVTTPGEYLLFLEKLLHSSSPVVVGRHLYLGAASRPTPSEEA